MANEFKIKKGLIVTGASGGTVVDIQGSQGQLFSVTDNLTGSIFAVSDISGVPIMDVNSSGVSYFTGNVGIGTLNPTGAKLVVESDTVPQILVKNSSGTNSQILFEDNSGSTQNASITFDQAGQNALYITTSYDSPSDGNRIYLQPGGETAMTLVGGDNTTGTAGYVGIGSTGPIHRLYVAGDIGQTDGSRIWFRGSSSSSTTGSQSYVYSNGLNLQIKGDDNVQLLGDGGGVIAHFDYTGKVGIGNTDPLAALDISNTSTSIYQQWSYDNPGANNYNLQLTETVTSGNVRWVFDQKNAGTVYSDVLVFNQGNVGIGTDEPSQKLSVSGNIELDNMPANGTRYLMTNENNTGTGRLNIQAGEGSAAYGGAINLFANAHATNPGWVMAGISSGSGTVGAADEGRFVINTHGLGTGTNIFTVLRSGPVGVGTTTPSTEGNLSLAAKTTVEGGHLILEKGTSNTEATHIDNAADSFRIMGGTNASSGSVDFSINHINQKAYFPGYVGFGITGPSYPVHAQSGNGSWMGYFYNTSSTGIGAHIETNASGTEPVLRVSSIFGGGNNAGLQVLANGNSYFGRNITTPTQDLSTTATPTNFGVYTSEIRLIQTPNGGLKECRVITDNYGEWILVGRYAASAMSTIQNTWSSVSGLTTGDAQNETTEFSADFGDSYPTEVRIMGSTDFTKWRDTRTVDFVYGVPEGRQWKYFFSGGVENGMAVSTKYGWGINGAYDGFGRWVNPAQNFVRMSDTNVTNPSAAYTTATANAFNWEVAADAKITVSATRVFSGQDTFVTAGFGNDDGTQGFFDEYPNETNNMGGGLDFSSSVWVLIKLPNASSGGGSGGDNFWSASASNIYNTNPANVGIGTTDPENLLHVEQAGLFTGIHTTAGIRVKSSGASAIDNYHGTIALSRGTGSVAISAVQEDTDSDIMGMAFFTHPSATGGDAAVEQMRLDQNGNLAIGTQAASEKLEVAGNIILDAADARLKIKGGGGGTNSGIDWTFTSNTTSYAKMELDYDTRASTGLLIDSGYPMTLDYSSGTFSIKKNGSSELTILNGKVGINETNPVYTLHVDGSVNAASGLYSGATDQNSSTRYAAPDNEIAFARTTATTQWFKVIVSGGSPVATRVSITSAGDNTNMRDEYLVNTAGYGFYMHIQRLPGVRYNSSKLLAIAAVNPSNGGGTEIWIKMLGMTSGSGTTVVASNVAVRTSAQILASATTSPPTLTPNDTQLDISTYNRNYSTLMCSRGGWFGDSVAIGLSANAVPGSKLEVNGTINFNASGDKGFICNPGAGSFSLGDIDDAAGGTYINGDGTYINYYAQTVLISRLDEDGTLTVIGDMVAYGSPSDIRLKENIKPIESALDKVIKLQGVTFDWKESDSILDIKEDIGFIAQDVQKVVPELVRENKDGMLSMRHQGIAPILLEAIKELKAEIDLLKSKPCTCNKCNCNI